MSTVTVHKYKCPLCDQEYDDERLVRAHISLSTDKAHSNRNGVMEDVQAVGDDGEDTLTGYGTIADANMDEDVPADAFPPSITDEKLAILRTAVRNANVDSISEINRRAEEMYDIDLSYQTVRRTIKDFFVVEDENDEESTYEDLTATQQAIVDYMAVNPDENYSTVANTVGTSDAYPSRVEQENEQIIKQRAEDIQNLEESWTDEMELVIDELSKETDAHNPDRSYKEIAEAAGVGINTVSKVILGFSSQLENRINTANPANTETKGMSASPQLGSFQDTVGTEGEDTGEEAETEDVEVTEESEGVETKVEMILEKVRSQRRIAETQLEHSESESAVGKLALAKELEDDLSEIVS